MKKRNRLLAILLAFAMVLAFMPAMVFADDEVFAAGYNGSLVEEFVGAGGETILSEARNSAEFPTDGGLLVIITDSGTIEITGYTAVLQNNTLRFQRSDPCCH